MTKLVIACAVSLLATVPAAAQSARGSSGTGTITACSTYGKGCITGAVRPGRFGQEVRLPGGTWLPCARDCRRTLTDETIDFWMKRDAERPSRPDWRR